MNWRARWNTALALSNPTAERVRERYAKLVRAYQLRREIGPTRGSSESEESWTSTKEGYLKELQITLNAIEMMEEKYGKAFLLGQSNTPTGTRAGDVTGPRQPEPPRTPPRQPRTPPRQPRTPRRPPPFEPPELTNLRASLSELGISTRDSYGRYDEGSGLGSEAMWWTLPFLHRAFEGSLRVRASFTRSGYGAIDTITLYVFPLFTFRSAPSDPILVSYRTVPDVLEALREYVESELELPDIRTLYQALGRIGFSVELEGFPTETVYVNNTPYGWDAEVSETPTGSFLVRITHQRFTSLDMILIEFGQNLSMRQIRGALVESSLFLSFQEALELLERLATVSGEI